MCPMQILVSTKHNFQFDIDATHHFFLSLTISFIFHPTFVFKHTVTNCVLTAMHILVQVKFFPSNEALNDHKILDYTRLKCERTRICTI